MHLVSIEVMGSKVSCIVLILCLQIGLISAQEKSVLSDFGCAQQILSYDVLSLHHLLAKLHVRASETYLRLSLQILKISPCY